MAVIQDYRNVLKDICAVAEAVSRGELAETLVATAEGEIDDAKRTVNKMTEKLRKFTTEVLRVTREVGSKGKLGEQASLDDLEGTWKELAMALNNMANKFKHQTRNIASVTAAVEEGDTTQEFPAEAQGAPFFYCVLNSRGDPRSCRDHQPHD
jgi:osomolarity two-component system, sensor histidine kinase NIK1